MPQAKNCTNDDKGATAVKDYFLYDVPLNFQRFYGHSLTNDQDMVKLPGGPRVRYRELVERLWPWYQMNFGKKKRLARIHTTFRYSAFCPCAISLILSNS